MEADDSYDTLHKAVLEEDSDLRIQALRSLIKAGKDVTSCNSERCTALVEAAKNGYDECIRLLLAAGADVNNSDEWGQTALMYAVSKGFVECGRLLLNAGADVNQSSTKQGDTALTDASWCGQVECLRLLLEAGANVNHADMSGDTALTCCLTPFDYSNKTQCLKLLINAGADINAGNNKNLQPIHYALKMWPDFKFAAEFLISENCNLNNVTYYQIKVSVHGEYVYYELEDSLKEKDRLDTLQLLLNCGCSRQLCQSFIVEKDTLIRNFVQSVVSQPNTLQAMCVFDIRRNLGLGIKSKISKLNLPNVIQNLILLKDILSPECFI